MDTEQKPRSRTRLPLVQFNVDRDLLDAIDRAARRERMTRTTWLTQAALAHLPADIAEEIDRP